MSATVIEFASAARRQPADVGSPVEARSEARKRPDRISGLAEAKFCFWRGASGERYVHHIYELRDCPELPPANYVLLGRDEQGRRKVLKVGRTKHSASSLNLAEIRYRGALLGASEVHLHLLADSENERRLIDIDLHSGLFAEQSIQSRSA